MRVHAKLKAEPICPICKNVDAAYIKRLNETRQILARPDRIEVHRWECCGKVFDVPVMRVEVYGEPPQWWPIVCLDLDEGKPN